MVLDANSTWDEYYAEVDTRVDLELALLNERLAGLDDDTVDNIKEQLAERLQRELPASDVTSEFLALNPDPSSWEDHDFAYPGAIDYLEARAKAEFDAMPPVPQLFLVIALKDKTVEVGTYNRYDTALQAAAELLPHIPDARAVLARDSIVRDPNDATSVGILWYVPSSHKPVPLL